MKRNQRAVLLVIVVAVVIYSSTDLAPTESYLPVAVASPIESLTELKKRTSITEKGRGKNQGQAIIDAELSVKEIDLYNIYTTNINAADEGDSRAQYQIYRVLNECPWSKKPSQNELERTIDEAAIRNISDNEFVDYLRDIYKQCEPIYREIEGQDLFELRAAWLAESAEQGFSIAVLDLIPMEQRGESITEVDYRDAIKKGFLEAGNDRSFIQRAVFSMLDYSSRFLINDQTSEYGLEKSVDFNAWQIVFCRYSLEAELCLKEFYSRFEASEFYNPTALNSAKERADQISRDIAQGNLDQLFQGN